MIKPRKTTSIQVYMQVSIDWNLWSMKENKQNLLLIIYWYGYRTDLFVRYNTGMQCFEALVLKWTMSCWNIHSINRKRKIIDIGVGNETF